MRVKVWGCRGSIPAPGPHTVRYGGNTTCVEVRLRDGTLLIFDAGSGIRALGRHLLEEGPREVYLFLTHAHWDHLVGFPFFQPAYSSRFIIHVRGGPRAKASLERYLRQQMEPPYFPVPFDAMQAEFDFTPGEPTTREIGGAEVTPVRLSHPNGGYGFKVVEAGRALVFLPDNELDFPHEGRLPRQEYIACCAGADLLLHDAQYTDAEYPAVRGWGHSSLSSTVALGLQAGVRRLGLFHHDPERTDQAVDALVAAAQAQVQDAGGNMAVFAAREGMEIVP